MAASRSLNGLGCSVRFPALTFLALLMFSALWHNNTTALELGREREDLPYFQGKSQQVVIAGNVGVE